MAKRPGQQKLTVIRLSFAEACAAVDRLHRHHKKPQGHMWSHGVLDEQKRLCGVAIVGRPVARAFDDGLTVEVTRVATDGTPNACSALYGAAWNKARVDHWRAITYTQDGESGASLRAVGWRLVAELDPRTGWDTPSRRRQDRGTDGVGRQLWEQARADAPPFPDLTVLRHEIRHEIPCAGCGNYIPQRVGRGRPARHCSDTCRKRTSRRRAKAASA
ncbi:XF1762 family protein [Streptomyces bangladeshensis]|uniref:Uncharacterized protein n=1 Tax=Streptomyces bangladeshensis TaxID=295352 RepID=A0ABP5N400_9ACTN